MGSLCCYHYKEAIDPEKLPEIKQTTIETIWTKATRMQDARRQRYYIVSLMIKIEINNEY